jgi:tripartite-type tricarboxylate transporter receptor subunit TctC
MSHAGSLRRLGLALLGASLCGFAPAARADDFYAGKTITMTVGVGPGGGYDLYARLAAEFLGRHIPGKPNVIVVNMPGGGGLRAAIHLFNTAPKDGTALCAIVQSVGFDSVLGELPVRADQFSFIGRMTSSVEMQLIWHTSATKTLDDAKHRVTVIGATGTSSPSAIVPRLLNDAIKTQFRIVGGYTGTQESSLAMERGEVEGTLKSLESLQVNNRDWLDSGKVRVLWQLAMHPHPSFPDVPAIGQLGEDEEGRAMMRLIASTAEIGRSIATAPGVPADRVKMLRDAFEAMIADPDFQAAAKQRGATLSPAKGEAIQTIIQDTIHTPPNVVQRVKRIISAK